MSFKNNTMPKGIPYIIGNEAAERYSFYGMKSILFIFLTVFMKNKMGEIDTLGDATATLWVHLFIFGAYGLSILGAILSDVFWGKYKTIVYLSLVYIAGHFVLAIFETQTGFMIGLILIAIGAGGIKPCVSAHVGDQFDDSNKHLIEKMYAYFYFTINAGSIIAYISAGPLLRNEYLISKGLNSLIAFGLPGVLMVIALVVFVLGKNKYISVKPAGWKLYKEELFSKTGKNVIRKLVPIYLFVSIFFALFDQTSSTWVNQADNVLMNKTINLGFTSFEFYPSQIGFFNPLLIILFIPIITGFVYPFLRKRMKLGAINKIAIGLLVTALSFTVIYFIQTRLDAGLETSILWQILAYLFLTIGEIFVSITALEFSYTQAPNKMKSFILSFYLLSVAVGNLIVIASTKFLENADGSLNMPWSKFFLLYTILMYITFILFTFLFRNYKEQTFVQGKNTI
ncbi:MAG: MFS transporter [Chitinophagales bacterium]